MSKLMIQVVAVSLLMAATHLQAAPTGDGSEGAAVGDLQCRECHIANLTKMNQLEQTTPCPAVWVAKNFTTTTGYLTLTVGTCSQTCAACGGNEGKKVCRQLFTQVTVMERCQDGCTGTQVPGFRSKVLDVPSGCACAGDDPSQPGQIPDVKL